jgi:hypothetical protein
VDVKTSKLITSSICIEGRDLPLDAPTQDELIANGGARFKRMLEEVIELCVQKFRAVMLLK